MPLPRSFKTKWFSKAAKKHGVSDPALCQALIEARKGQADDLGGGVFKKRLNDNEDRSIILAKGGGLSETGQELRRCNRRAVQETFGQW